MVFVYNFNYQQIRFRTYCSCRYLYIVCDISRGMHKCLLSVFCWQCTMMWLILSYFPYFLVGLYELNWPLQFCWPEGHINTSSYIYHQIGSIMFSHCCHIFLGCVPEVVVPSYAVGFKCIYRRIVGFCYPRPVFTFWYCRCLRLCVCVFMCPCVCINHGHVRTITHHSFKLESPNLE